MKQQVLVTLSLAAAALITGCATKQSASADRARLEAAEVTAAEERQEQAEVAAEPVIEPTEAEPLPVIEPAPEATPAPAPVETRPAPAKPIVRPQPVAYTVTAGDSVSALSVRFGVRQADILALNPSLRGNPDRLMIGQKVYLPAGTDVTKAPKPRAAKPASAPAKGTTVYVVQPGDVLGGIALTHGVSIATIQKANNLKGDTIFVGQKLSIPGAKSRGRVVTLKDNSAAKPEPKKAEPKKAEPKPAAPVAPKAEEPKEEPAPIAQPEPLPPPPVEEGLGAEALPPPPPAPAADTQTYVVQPGEDLVQVAIKWGVTLSTLRAANGLDDATTEVAPGTTLKIPAGAAQ